MHATPHCRPLLLMCLLACVQVCWGASALAQGIDPANRPIAEVRIVGLVEVSEQLVRNQIRSAVGEPYNPQTVNADIARITHLGRFSTVVANVTPQPSGAVVLTFTVAEQPLLADVQVAGNRAVSDMELLGLALLRAGDPLDPFLIERGRQRIVTAYEDRGYFVAVVTVDETLLQEQHILIYEVREGPRVRIRGLAFEGNQAFSADQLKAQIRSETYFPILRKGTLSREQLDLDASSLRDFYRNRGYLDAQVGRRIDLSPDQLNAVATFLIEEGPRYIVDTIRVEGAVLFPEEQILRNLRIHPGDAYAADKVRRSGEAVANLYGELGFLETQVNVRRIFHTNRPRVDLIVEIEEGVPSIVGQLSVRGNQVTQDRVILRQARGLDPGRPFDRVGLDETRRRLSESPLFGAATVTVLGQPGDPARDVLIEVEEQQTGSVNLGAGISSDVGVIGAIDVVQRNFDITDFPASPGELFTGQAFRGAGQYFSLTLQPGDEFSRYAVTFREPYAFETNYFFESTLYYYTREREDYEEQRFGGGLGLGRRFGDVWSASAQVRAYEVDIDQIDDDAAVDVFAVEGESRVTSLGFKLERNTTDSRLFPTRGSVWEVGAERVGALGGDYDFTRATARYLQFWTLDEDFFGRRTILSARLEVGHIFEDDEAPVFERFYAGGHNTFRGFKFRGVGPRGIRNDTGEVGEDSVGGDWLLLAGLEYNFPIAEEYLRGVVFSDMGTVTDDPGVDEWRVSVGAGLRIKIPFLGQAPFALDFAVPVMKEDGDETQVISFSLDLPL